MDFDTQDLLQQLLPVLHKANQMAVDLRTQGLTVVRKRDGSLTTNADWEIEQAITQQLRVITPGTAVVGEEALSDGSSDEASDVYWLIDPIDGTSGYVTGSDEYAISVGLIMEGYPVFGVLATPSDGQVFAGDSINKWALQCAKDGQRKPISAKTTCSHTPTVLHSSSERASFVADLVPANSKFVSMGSAVKFALVSQGAADLYVRKGSLNDYDIAGGHALALAAGCTVTNHSGKPLTYPAVGGYQPGFVVSAPSVWLTSTNSA